MIPEAYRHMAQKQDEHWWYKARRELVTHCLVKTGHKNSQAAKLPALDLGVGTGANVPLLSQFASSVIGVDRHRPALELTQQRYPEIGLVQLDANTIADVFAPDSFGLAAVFNVLYHKWVVDDQAVLDQLYTLLATGGRLIITEPACMLLMRAHDKVAMGKRRYTHTTFRDRLIKSGFEIECFTLFNATSFLPALALASWEKLRPTRQNITFNDAPDASMPPRWLNALMLSAMRLEHKFITNIAPLPVGVTLLAIARKTKRGGHS